MASALLLASSILAGLLLGSLLWRLGRGEASRRLLSRLYQPLVALLLFLLGVEAGSSVEVEELAGLAPRVAVYLAFILPAALAAGLLVEAAWRRLGWRR